MTKEISKPKIELQRVGIFRFEDGIYIHKFDVNYFEFNDVRIQIKNNQFPDYYVRFDDQFLPIDKNGRVENWPRNMFNMLDDQLIKILDWL